MDGDKQLPCLLTTAKLSYEGRSKSCRSILVLGLPASHMPYRKRSRCQKILCLFVNSFSLENKQKSLGARTTHLITGQLKHWLPSKMPALNYSVTHRIRHSCSYCTEYGCSENQEQQFFYNGIRALEKCWIKRISVAGVYVEK